MKKLIFFLFLIPICGWAQPLDFSTKSFDFQSVYFPNTDSLKLTINNTSGFDIAVEGVSVFSIYETIPFYVKDSIFTLSSGSSHDLWVYFMPNQNILHQMYMVVHTDFRGDYLISLTGKGKFLNTYYNSTYNKSEQDLKAAMKTLLAQGYQQQTYNGARDHMYGDIDNANGDVTCVYTGRVATFNTRSGATANNFNCEHTFPQGFFSQNLPMRSDVHHLYSTDMTANSQRGNLPFGVVTGTPTWSNGGSKKGNGVFEPRDAQKGRVARSLFYFVVRYQDYSNHVQGQETILRSWFDQFPPTAIDVQRNDDIYALQKNRNPFVDYPQFLKRISKISGTSSAIPVKALFVSRDTVDMRFQKDSLTYTVSVVNTGNTIVNLSDFSIDDSVNFTFETAMSNTGLLPGEGMEIKLKVHPQSNTTITDHLNFVTDATGMNNVSIALLGEWLFVSVPDVSIENSLEVYPNPTSNSFVVSWENHNDFEVEIYNVLGELVLTKNVNTTSTVDISNLPRGSYIIKTTDGLVIKQTKLVVQ